MKSIFYILGNPVVQFLVLLSISLLFGMYKKRITATVFLLILLFWIWLTGCSPFPQYLLANLEQQYLPLTVKVNKDSARILVLGAGHSLAPNQSYFGQLAQVSQIRLAEGIRIHRLNGNSALVLSGGNNETRSLTQAEMTSLAAIELGVSPKDTMQLRSPKNTEEEIAAYKQRFGSANLCILVTSANHMPRAMILCRKAGLNVVPAPTDFYFNNQNSKTIYNFKPSVQKLHQFQIALREIIGIWTIKLSI